jgi:site-specific recombinase XerD
VSACTLRSYRNDLLLFQTFLAKEQISGIEQVDYLVIDRYVSYMEQQPNPRFERTGLSDSSIARRLAALSSYFQFVRATSQPGLHNPTRDLERRWTRNDEPKPIDERSLERLLAGVCNLRDRFLLTLFVATGLRVSEVHQLNRDTIRIEVDVDESGSERVLGVGEVIGKGNKKRRFFVDERTLEQYADYLNARTDDLCPLFLSERKQRMSIRAIQYTLTAWCKRLNLDHANVHRLRHSFATRLANGNINSMILKDLLGHSSLTTSLRYFKLHDTTLARGYFSAMEFLRGND